jgi:S-DNA-T family DNA segregation ATPase FtsK/SpoIIIE
MLSREQQRDMMAAGLLALALFFGAALMPVSILGPRGAAWFPSGNMMGLVGGTTERGLTGLLGGSAFFVPILLLVSGLRACDWLSPGWTVRLSVLSLGLMLILPVGLQVMAQGPEMAGAWGGLVGPPLNTALGFLGAVLLLSLLLVVLSVGTLGWNPLRSLAYGMAQGSGVMARGASRLVGWGERMRARWDERARSRLEQTPPMELLEGEASDEDDVEDDPADEAEDEPSGGEGQEEAEDPAEDPAEDEVQESEDDDLEADADAVPDPDAVEVPPDEPYLEPVDELEALLPDPFPKENLGETGLPPVEFMTTTDDEDRGDMERELDALGEVLVEKLRTFNVESEIGGRTTGPVVTQYEVIPAPGVKVNKIANLDADLALAMKAKSIRIVAPIPGKGAVGVEIPNPEPEIVRLREILDSNAYQKSSAALPLALGKDLNGKPYVADLRKMPHILIAGATGSGKSICINTIITSLVYRHTPETLRLLMVDPKMVELSTYKMLPHLRHSVVTDPRDAAGLLKWAVLEMERRYKLLSNNGVRSIDEFNERVRDGVVLRRFEPIGPEEDPDRWIYQEGILPYVVVVVDELADLMMTVQSEVEKPLTSLAQKARAIGIHLIVATQRPSVNVITGLIKANFPSRIAFRVASKTDSRTILDQNGADALLGNGDMLFLPPGSSEPVRIQGAYISTAETDRMMGWYKERVEAREQAHEDAEAQGEADILEQIRSHEQEEAGAPSDGPSDWDDLFRAAAEVCIQHEQGSTSLLQRRLKIGYGRAARIVDQLHEAGILGPSEGSKARDVLVGMDALDLICSSESI